MKRHFSLQKFSHDHQHTLALALRIKNALAKQDKSEFLALSQEVCDFYQSVLKSHFNNEENSFFLILSKQYPEHNLMVNNYLAEHKKLRNLVRQLAEEPKDASQLLNDFAILLKSHTRNEERELFPLIEATFSDKELHSVLLNN